MEIYAEKKSNFIGRLDALLKEGYEICNGLPSLDLTDFSGENIGIHKWCTKVNLLAEEILPTGSLILEDVRNALKKSKKSNELFEKVMGVAEALAEECKAGHLDRLVMHGVLH